MFLVFMLVVIGWSAFLWRLFKWLRHIWEGHENLCLQVAELDAYAGGIRTDRDRLEIETEPMMQNMIELEQQQEMVSDGIDAIHYALVEMGGYVRMSELSANQRRHMYTQERGSMVTANVMGQQRYLQTIRQQNHGFSVGQDTDVRMDEGEQEGESENDSAADDPTVTVGNEGPWTPLINILRDEINNALRMDNFRDASELQRMVLIILDYLNAGNLRVDVMRNSVLEQISNRLASMVPRHRMLHPAAAERYSGYAVIVRQLMVMGNET
jgi:hypothetical protein